MSIGLCSLSTCYLAARPHFKLSATIVPSFATAQTLPGPGLRARNTPFCASSQLVCEPCARAERATAPSASETRSGSRARAQLRKLSRARLAYITCCTAPLSRGPRHSGALLAARSRNRGSCTRTFSEYVVPVVEQRSTDAWT